MASTGDGRVDVIVGAADHGDRDGYDRNTRAGQIGRPGLFAGFDTLELLALCDNNEAEDWQERALCAETDPESFFPEKGGSTREAKRICSGCEVRAECLEYALAHDERFGIWGGLSERERRKLKREAS
jgi:WhiB family redox-sensing transcriptional regulator